MPPADHTPLPPRSGDHLAQLTAVQALVLERAELLHLQRTLRLVLEGDLATAELAERVTAAIGTALAVDRSSVLFTDRLGPDRHWTRGGAELPPPGSWADGPAELCRLLEGSARSRERVTTDLVVVSPLVARDRLVGWLVVEREEPGPWPASTLDVLEQHAPDLAVALLLARTTEELRSLTAAE